MGYDGHVTEQCEQLEHLFYDYSVIIFYLLLNLAVLFMKVLAAVLNCDRLFVQLWLCILELLRHLGWQFCDESPGITP